MNAKKLVTACLTILFVMACSHKTPADFNSDLSKFKNFITSFSGGLVAAQSDIRVVLAFENPNWKTNQPLDNDLFDISPSIEGKVVALSPHIVAFVPNEKLESGTTYQVTLHVSKIKAVPKECEDFNFTVQTIKQDFIINTLDIQSYSPDKQYLNAVLKTADVMSLETAKKIIHAQQDGENLPIKFEEDVKSGTAFKLIIDQIKRSDDASEIEVEYDGTDFGIDQKGSFKYAISAKNDFKIVAIDTPEDDVKMISINFSEPLQKNQDFSGLVSIEQAKNLKFSAQGNVLKVYFNGENKLEKPIEPVNTIAMVSDTTAIVADTVMAATDSVATVIEADAPENDTPEVNLSHLKIEVFQGIESQYGTKMKENYNNSISLEPLKPDVRFIKNGTILPSSNNLKINFEAVNLSAVDVKVYKIYKNNILQFLQENELNGARNLKRVAQPIAKSKIELNKNQLLQNTKWNAYSLDLSKIITPEPGAIYRVEMSFNKKYSLYKCNDSTTDTNTVEEETIDEKDVNYSDSYDDYYYDDFEWRESQDPCSDSYFYNARVGTNILASDLGVIAKRGENKSYHFTVANIVDTTPIENATVTLYSYQQQKLGSQSTDSQGFATFKLDTFAYFAIVTKGKQATYVKLDDGLSLSVSNFDVSGEVLQKGLKGYLYGERGVWRPGDDLYLSFILNDQANKLPLGHPIKFKLNDPNGKTTYETVQKTNELNHYSFIVPTNADAPTGSWEAVVSVGGAKFYKNIKIETIKPNRLKIKNIFQAPILSAAHQNTDNLEVAWLHGAVAKNLKVVMEAKFSEQTTVFKHYEKYIFDDETRKFNTEETTIFSGTLDAAGKVSIPIQPKIQGQAPGLLRAAMITKVFEEGGDFSTDVVAMQYAPYHTYVGLKLPELTPYQMLETRKNNVFEVVTVDENGQPKANRQLEVSIFKVQWRWWWDASEDNISNYNTSNANTAFKTFSISTDQSGKGRFQFSLKDEEWGRYLIRISDPSGGHATSSSVNIDWPSWSGKTRNTDATSANMLVFSTNKKEYAVGETATIAFPSSAGGRALIAIENGSKVLKTIWAKTTAGETKVSVPITADMAPNVYFNITLLQPHAFTKNDSPIRMYGIVPIAVIDKNTILQPQITMPEVLKPEQNFNLKVSEKTGKSMTYTIALVDEGLLDLTRFKTPNAWDNFYAREALGVKTWDIYDNVIGAYGGKINQIFSIGGDQDLGGGKTKKANRFKPVVIYLGPFSLGKGDSKTHQIKLPKYIGSVRAMVVAANAQQNAYGSTEKAVPVRSPLMALASVPRKISPAERVTIPVTIFAMEKHVKNVSIQIKTNNGIRVLGNTTQKLTFNQPDEKMVYFDLAVGQATGIGKIQVIATSGKERSVYDVSIDMTNPNPITNLYTDVVVAPHTSQTISWKTFGIYGSNAAKIEVSSMPNLNFNNRLQYLIAYPHGCVEQTTSSVFPQLYLSDVCDLDANRLAMIQKNVTAGINRLSGFQLPSGGLSYWQGQSNPDDWGTSYAGHFLIEAEKKGYVLPLNFKQKWISFQQKTAKNWRFESSFENDLAQAYRLYTLALSGNPDLASMNRLRETNNISNEAKLRLAAAYTLAGQKAAGNALLLKSHIEPNENPHQVYNYYGSAERNAAMTLESLILLGQQQKSFIMAQKLAKKMATNEWMSTQTTAYCLYAMSKFAQVNGGKGIQMAWTKNGKSDRIYTTKATANRDLEVTSGNNSMVVKNNHNNTVYVRVMQSGILPIGQEQTAMNNLVAQVVFKNRKGEKLQMAKINQGTELIAEVQITNLQNEMVSNMALSQILPSGFEIVNTRYTDFGEATHNVADYIDIRDDRTHFYFALKSRETKTFKILLNASYLGTYYLPGLQCEAMYDHSVLARTKGFWVTIVK
ncbi:alpha-2-macroglobulin family protein [Flavobacterium branchiophilum]|uniref:Lipoprotein n=1 Tax=Flavobacterium branchiophilum TaxID=55197 RepID=A0A2H3L204_9FLAO|nr:MG2 domain-containing protein [Flavobacterium branchiophilum]PDS26989.1 hypothetical protein B0A77_00775 [Flavobacterium branchiophilum]